MTVGICRATPDDVAERLAELLDLIGYRPGRNQVFIKPNIVAPHPPETGVITHPRVVEALLRCWRGYDIVIGESASVAQKTGTVLELSGYRALAERYGARIVDLDQEDRVLVPWRFGRLSLPSLALTHEYINVPTMKTHVSTVVSLGLKNQKGLLLPHTKRAFHLKWGLHQGIAALAQAVRPALTVVDGLIGLEGDGPGRAGTPVQLGLLLAGTDMMAVDQTAAEIMGFAAGEVPHLAPRPRPPTVGLEVEDVRRPFSRPRQDQFSFGPVRLRLMRACSGCVEAFAAAFARADKSSLTGRIDVLMGLDTERPPEEGGAVCRFGNCTRKAARRLGVDYVPGCPPRGPEAVAHAVRIALGSGQLAAGDRRGEPGE